MSTRSSFVRCVKLSGATKRVEPRIITREDRTGNQGRVHKIHALVSLPNSIHLLSPSSNHLRFLQCVSAVSSFHKIKQARSTVFLLLFQETRIGPFAARREAHDG